MIDTFKVLEPFLILCILIVCYAGVAVVMLQNIEAACRSKKVTMHDDKEKFSAVTIIYMGFVYGQLLVWGLRILIWRLVPFDYFTWVDNMLYYYLAAVGIFCMGIFNLTNVAFLYERKKEQEIKRIWIALKIGMIPFYLLNVVHYLCESRVPEEMYWTSVFATLFLIFSFPVTAFVFPCILNFINGCIGWYYIYYLRRQGKEKKRLFWGHYILQAFPILDLISMVLILKRYREGTEKIT